MEARDPFTLAIVSEFSTMSLTTSCPDLVHLRLFFHKPAFAPEADSVRAHLEQCEVCRAVVAGFVAGDGNTNTLADAPVFPASRETASADTVQVFRKSEIAAGPGVGMSAPAPADMATMSDARPAGSPAVPRAHREVADQATMDDTRAVTSRTIARAVSLLSSGATSTSTSDATVFTSPGVSANDHFQLAGSVQAESIAASRESNETCYVPIAEKGGRAAASHLTFTPTRVDIPDDSLPEATTLEGVTVPGYDILEELGRGGMGVVYKARHRRLRRLVALKMVLAGAHVGQVGLARFRAEAEAVAKLLHPNIVQIFETGEHEGRPFFSLEYVEGGSLDQRINKSPTSPRGAAQFVETLARTMDVAHQRGIVHRDLKPANILLAKLGSQSSMTRARVSDSSSLPEDHWSRSTVPKIADFGLAKRTDDDSSQTQSGAILGTPSYMAPEQAGGKNREIGPAVDIYALGAILYEMLVGRPPFKAGNPIDTVRQVIEQEPVPPRQLEPRVPYDLETICLKCLEKDPARRFGTAALLADDLRRFVEGHPILARPTPAWERAWKWGKRRPAIVALLAVIPLAITGIVLFVFWHNVSLRSRLAVALADERRARQRELDAVQEHHRSLVGQEGQKLFDSARVAVAASDWSNARLGLEKALTTLGGEASFEKLRSPAQALLKQVEQELRVEADRRASLARLQQFVVKRDEAQFLGTLYTGMDLAANLEAARTSVDQALAVYGVVEPRLAQPKLDAYLSESQKAEVVSDCYQLFLILAETAAQSASAGKPAESEKQVKKALGYLEQARRIGTPSRAFHLRRARYLNMLGDKPTAAQAESQARGAPVNQVLDHFLMADELYRREKFGEAITEFDQVLERQPGHFWAQYLNAICLLRQGRPAEARSLLSACLAQRSDFVWLYLLRGFSPNKSCTPGARPMPTF
jgi:eukaryotic-like serine/threonine-protein kinase